MKIDIHNSSPGNCYQLYLFSSVVIDYHRFSSILVSNSGKKIPSIFRLASGTCCIYRKRIPSVIAERWSRRKLEVQPKEVNLVDLDKWLEMDFQVKEMSFGCPKTIETLNKMARSLDQIQSDQGSPRSRKTYRVIHLHRQ